MEKYWMVHRPGWPGNPGGPPTVKHATFKAAAKEAERLTRKELARFIILESVMSFEPYEPISISIKRIGMGPSSELEDSCEREGCSCDEGHDPWCCPSEPEETEPEPCPAVDSSRVDDCTCSDEAVAEHETDLSGCSCWWCDPGNHDVENCEFPSCQCKSFLDELELKIIETQLESFDQLTEVIRDGIPKADCPCGCTDEAIRDEVKYLEPLDEDAAELRREWMPKPQADLSSSFAGWSVEDFERSLTTNRQARSDLCDGLLRLREALSERACNCRPAPDPDEYIECDHCRAIRDWEPGPSAHWCPHCGYDTRVERPMGTGL